MTPLPKQFFLTNHSAILTVSLLLLLGIVTLLYAPQDMLLADPLTSNMGANQSQITPVITQGWEIHGADTWHDLGYEGLKGLTEDSGSPVRVGIIDRGFSGFDALPSWEAPDPNGSRVSFKCWQKTPQGMFNPSNSFTHCEQQTSHGTHVAEVVLDMAPKVDLYLSNARNEMQLSQAITWMMQNDVDVINYSLNNRLRGPGNGNKGGDDDSLDSFQRAIASSAAPFIAISGGNEARKNWYGRFHDNNNGNDYLQIWTYGGELNAIDLTAGETVTIALRWQGGFQYADCDLDLVLVESGTDGLETVRESTNSQTGSIDHESYEVISKYLVPTANTSTRTFYIGIKIGSDGCDSNDQPDWIQLQVGGTVGELTLADYDNGRFEYITDGEYFQIGVPAEVRPLSSSNPGAAFAVAATDQDQHTLTASSQSVKRISSRGPTVYTSSITKKPDLAGITCVRVRTGGSGEFCGTSAAAPHVAGLAALVKSRFPNKNGKDIASYLVANVLDRGTTGEDNQWGHGLAILPGARLEDGTSPGLLPDATPDLTILQGATRDFLVKTPLDGNIRVAADSTNHLSVVNCTSPNINYVNVSDEGEITIKGCEGTTDTTTLKLWQGNTLLRTYNVNVTSPTAQCLINVGTITGSRNRNGTWESSCLSENSPNSNSWAKFYKFRISQQKKVTIELSSARATRLYLLDGGTITSSQLASAVSPIGGTAKIEHILQPNRDYIVEAATQGAGSAATFELSLSQANAMEPPDPTNFDAFGCGRECLRAFWTVGEGVANYRITYYVDGQSSNPWIKTIAAGQTVGSTQQTDLTTGIQRCTDYEVTLTAQGNGVTYTTDWSGTAGPQDAETTGCPPTFSSERYVTSLPADTAPQTNLIQVTATTTEPSQLVYEITNGNTDGKFSIHGTTGWISLAEELAISDRSEYLLTVTASAMTTTATATVTINVTEPLLPSAPAPGNIHQDSSTPTQIEVDWDQVDHTTRYQLEYRVTTGSSWRLASSSITTSSYTLSNLACGTDYYVRITAYGDGTVYDPDWGTSSTSTLSTEICPDPVFNPGTYRESVPENAELGRILTTVTATDPNGDPVEYTIHSGNEGGKFDIGISGGVITLEAALDRSSQSSYTLGVRATDPAGNYGTATVYITVLEPQLPEAPAPANVLRTGATENSITFQWDAVDNTGRYRVQYRLNSTYGWSTSTSSATTTSHTISNLACETGYEVQVNAHGDGVVYHRDWGADSGPWPMTSGTCPNPVFINEPYSFEVAETAVNGYAVGVVTAEDPTPGDSVSYTITDGNQAGKFDITSSTGEITVAGALDVSVETSYTLEVTARDNAGYTDTTTVAITVLDNAAPAPADFSAIQTHRRYIILVWNLVEHTTRYRVEFRQVGESDWAVDTETQTGRYQVVNPLECGTEYQFRISAHSDGSSYDPGWGVTSAPINATTDGCGEPVFDETSYDFVVTRNFGAGTVVGTVSATDPDDGDTVSYSILSGNGDGKFTVGLANGEITLAAAPATLTTYILTVQASDGSHGSTAEVTIQVVENRAPAFGSGSYSFSVWEDAALETPVGTVTADDPENETVSYSFASGNEAGKFAIDGATGEIIVAAALDYLNAPAHTLYVQASDGTNNTLAPVDITVLDSVICSSGAAVADPANNAGLVGDCIVLLGLRDALAGDGTLNWSARLAMSGWDGVTMAGTPQRVTELNLGSRNLQGTIPAGLGSLSALEVLDLNFNFLRGTIPVELGSLTGLTRLALHTNALSGGIPTELGNLSALQELDLNFNFLNGPIPTELGNLTSLSILDLSQNRLTGSIPTELDNLTGLTQLKLQSNRLTGSMPTELGSLTSLVTLWLYDNRLTGSVPASLTALTSLQALHISDNSFTGCLPAALRTITFNDLAQLNLPDC